MTMPDDPLTLLEACCICPWRCGINRRRGQIGKCKVAARAVVASAGPHFGEEPPLVGTGGSGTIFFAGCNLSCAFCQNFDISQGGRGEPVSEDRLADMMLALEAAGCHNVNFVTPSHVTPQIVVAIGIARKRGLTLPLVYNSGGYDSVEMLRRMEGLFAIYMPDLKYLSREAASQYSGAWDYPRVARDALREMHRQVGDLIVEDGVAVRGLLVRHLVMPGLAEDSLAVVDFLARDVSPNTYVNVMGQYRPCYHAERHPEIDRRPTEAEVEQVRRRARKLRLRVARD